MFRRSKDKKTLQNSLDFDLERLEGRQMLAGVVVSNHFDVVDGDTSSVSALIRDQGEDGISLREAVLAANNTRGAQEITFRRSLSGATIALNGSALSISGSLTIDGSSLDTNITVDAQGALHAINVASGDLNLQALRITGANGSGIWFDSRESLSVSESTIDGNQGGGIHSTGGEVMITDSTISDNSASSGGGIDIFGGSVTLSGSTVSGNRSAVGGGGIQVGEGDLTLINSTVTKNSAAGGAIFVRGVGLSPTVTLQNSIVAGNPQGDIYVEDHVDGVTFAVDYSLIGAVNPYSVTIVGEGNLTGTEANPLDAGLVELAANGGRTMTHELALNSPALNAGDPSAIAGQDGVPEFDQRGQGARRIQFGRMDMGAVERQPVSVIGDVLQVIGQDDVNDRLRITETADSLRVRFNGTTSPLIPSNDLNDIEVMTFGGRDNVNIRLRGGQVVVVDAGADDDVVRARTTAGAELRGGGGHDRLFGGAADDALLGGEGNDRLVGSGGDDVLLGHSGNDVVLGGGGNDIMVGTGGDDVLIGGGGRDLMSGGSGTDRLVGGGGEDIVIGASTTYDTNVASLRSLMMAWTADQPVANRITAIQTGLTQLSFGSSVLDDTDRDTLIGGPQDDWVFVGVGDQRVGPNSDIVEQPGS